MSIATCLASRDAMAYASPTALSFLVCVTTTGPVFDQGRRGRGRRRPDHPNRRRRVVAECSLQKDEQRGQAHRGVGRRGRGAGAK